MARVQVISSSSTRCRQWPGVADDEEVTAYPTPPPVDITRPYEHKATNPGSSHHHPDGMKLDGRVRLKVLRRSAWIRTYASDAEPRLFNPAPSGG